MAKKRSVGCGGFIFGVLIVGAVIVFLFSMINGFLASENIDFEYDYLESTAVSTDVSDTAYDTWDTVEITTDTTEKVKDTDAPDDTERDDKEETYVPEGSNEIFKGMPANRNMYHQLDSKEKLIYKAVRDAMAAGETEATIKNIPYSEYDSYVDAVYQAYLAVYYDFPELFWMSKGWKASASHGSVGFDMNLTIGVHDYWTYTMNKQDMYNACISKAKAIAQEASKQSTTYDKVKYVHDYLVLNAEYNHDAAAENNKSVQKASSRQSHTIYGCLINKTPVCDGYSKTFKLIMNMLGINCEYVEGDTDGDGNLDHAWNYIQLDGQYYWMDTTWDDKDWSRAELETKYPKGIDYDYFCITTKDMYETHMPNDKFAVPDCTATTYNFYHMEKSYLVTYDYNAYCNALNEQKGSQIISVRFASESELTKAVNDLITGNYRFHDIPYFGGMKWRYLVDKQRETLKIFFVW